MTTVEPVTGPLVEPVETKWARLGDVACIDRKSIAPGNIADGTTYVGLENIVSGGKLLRIGLVDNGDLASQKFIFNADHILYGKLRPYLAKIAMPEFAGICSTDILPVRVGASMDKRFVAYFLRQSWVVDQVNGLSSGANLPRISAKSLESLEVPVFSLEYQRRVAAILDKADHLRTQRREALAHLDALERSIFDSMFSAPSSSWTETRLDAVSNVSSGITKGRKINSQELTTYPYLAVSNVQDRNLDLSIVKEIEVTVAEAERFRLQKGDLLMTEGGDPDKLGRGTVWNDELSWCLHQNHVFRVRISEVGIVIPIFLNWFLSSPESKAYFLRMAKQTTGIASINKTQLSATPLTVPPLELQQSFARRVAGVERLKEQHRTQLGELDTLFTSLQHRAFRGEL